MRSGPLEFRPYEEAVSVPNIVVDGSPNESTVLTLTHWPGIAQPQGLGADLSAEMAFNYLDRPQPHPPAEVVTNNHFDQDGLIGINALLDPDWSQQHRDRLVDIAAAGDFATYRHRDAARASMAIWAYAQPDRSPLGAALDGPYPAACALLYDTCLPLVRDLATDVGRFRDLWQDEDADLTASEQAIENGSVTIEELPEVSLAVVTITTDLPGGHRFASDFAELIHPMAINNATRCPRVLIVRGQGYLYVDRYETWVQYRSQRLPQRVDLAPLAEQLDAAEPGRCRWSATAASALVPTLRTEGSLSALSPRRVRDAVIAHLRTAPGAWDPVPDEAVP